MNKAPFTDCMSETTNTQIDNAKGTYGVMPMYNLIGYSDNYLKTLGSLCLFYRDEQALDDDGNITDFVDNNTNYSYKYKEQIIGQTGDDTTDNVEIMIQLNYLSNFQRTMEMPLINCEINLRVT